MEVFPDEITYTLSRSVMSNKIKSPAQRRYQQRRQRLHRPFYEFELSSENLSKSQAQTLSDFYIVHEYQRGNDADAFLLRDPDDNTRTDQDIGVGDGSTTQFSAINTYTVGNKSIDVVQGYLINGTVTIYVNGTEETNVTINNDSGLITFDTAPANGAQITGDYEFRRKCIFSEESIDFEIRDPLNRDSTYKIVEVP